MRTMLVTLLAIIFGMIANPASAAEHKPHVVAFGDSITYGGGTNNPDRQSWPSRIGAERVAVPSGCLVTICGEARPALESYGRTVLSQHPDVVIVAYGMNDLIHHTAREIYAGLREVKNRNAAHGIVTYVATLTPVGDRVWGLDSHRRKLNDLIRARFATWRVLDFDAALLSNHGRLAARFDSGDNLHPNARAYRVLGRVAGSRLAANAASPRL